MNKATLITKLQNIIQIDEESPNYEDLYWEIYDDLDPIKAGIRSSLRQAGSQPKGELFEDFLDDFSSPDVNSHRDILDLLLSPTKTLETWTEYKGMA